MQVRGDVTLFQVLNHPITAVPPAIFQEDESMKAIAKIRADRCTKEEVDRRHLMNCSQISADRTVQN